VGKRATAKSSSCPLTRSLKYYCNYPDADLKEQEDAFTYERVLTLLDKSVLVNRMLKSAAERVGRGATRTYTEFLRFSAFSSLDRVLETVHHVVDQNTFLDKSVHLKVLLL